MVLAFIVVHWCYSRGCFVFAGNAFVFSAMVSIFTIELWEIAGILILAAFFGLINVERIDYIVDVQY
jgi:hypothetical protein